jgi:hypothetical protein
MLWLDEQSKTSSLGVIIENSTKSPEICTLEVYTLIRLLAIVLEFNMIECYGRQ